MVKKKDKSEAKKIGEELAKAVDDAESELPQIKLRRDQLAGAIRVFRERMASGEPWPETPPTQN
jgi:hypothetical protein